MTDDTTPTEESKDRITLNPEAINTARNAPDLDQIDVYYLPKEPLWRDILRDTAVALLGAVLLAGLTTAWRALTIQPASPATISQPASCYPPVQIADKRQPEFQITDTGIR